MSRVASGYLVSLCVAAACAADPHPAWNAAGVVVLVAAFVLVMWPALVGR